LPGGFEITNEREQSELKGLQAGRQAAAYIRRAHHQEHQQAGEQNETNCLSESGENE
jgi:hypothetical protein